MSEKKIDLIAQMLAKAESTTPEEAEALTEHAERLMVKYMIDQATIDERRRKGNAKKEAIVEERIQFTGAYRGEMLHLAACVAGGLATVKTMQHTGGSGKVFTVWLVGFESDVAQAKTLLTSLQVQAAVAVRAWWKDAKVGYGEGFSAYEQEKARRSFVHGFGSGVFKRLVETRHSAVQEAGSGTEMVLVSRENQVKEYVQERAGGKARARTATGRDGAAVQGVAAGLKANTGGTAVGQGRGIEA